MEPKKRRGRPPRWKPADFQLIANESAKGLSAHKIAEKLGASHNAIKALMSRRGLFARQKSRKEKCNV